MTEVLVTVRVSDLIAVNQIVREVHDLVGAIGQMPPVVLDAVALRAAQGLTLAALRHLSVTLENVGPAHYAEG